MCCFSVFGTQKMCFKHFFPAFFLGCLPNVNSRFCCTKAASVTGKAAFSFWTPRLELKKLIQKGWWNSKLKSAHEKNIHWQIFQTQETQELQTFFRPDFYKNKQTQCHKFSFSGQFFLPWLPEISATRRGHGLAICGGTWIDCMSGESNLKIAKIIYDMHTNVQYHYRIPL